MSTDSEYSTRHGRACEFHSMLSPGDDAEQSFLSLEKRRGALGSAYVDNLGGDLWSRPQLGHRDRCLVAIAALATARLHESLVEHVRLALRCGVSTQDLDELMLVVAAYCGIPHGLEVQQAILPILEATTDYAPRPLDHKSDAARDRDAAARRTVFTGSRPAEPADDFAAMILKAGDVAQFAYRFVFGEVWARSELSARDRSLVVISILTAMGQEGELAVHVPAGLRHGLERPEIEEVMVQLAFYSGFPRAVEGIIAARAAFERVDRRAARTAQAAETASPA